MRQGDIIKIASDNESTPLSHDTYWLVVTHCCDLDRNDEPLELLPCHQISDVNGTYARGKNSRCLHFMIHEKCFAVFAREKIQKQPEFKSKMKIVYSIEDSERKILQNWLASRYRRQALDDKAHNDLIKLIGLDKLVKSTADELVGVWVNIDSAPHEEHKDDFKQMRAYELYFVFEADANLTDHQHRIESKLSSILERKKTILKDCITPHFLSVDDFSLREAMQFTLINFDYLSID